MSSWELIEVSKKECTPDNSRMYTIIKYCADKLIRCDIRDSDDMPVISFKGDFSDVRKHVIEFLVPFAISFEHASYIGEQLALCDALGVLYMQD